LQRRAKEFPNLGGLKMQNQERKVNISIDHNEPSFFSDELTVSHTESKFIFDFKQTTPRFDRIGNDLQQSLAIKHKTIVIDPVVAKSMMNAIKDNLANYEKQFGEIKLPKEKKTKGKKTPDVITEGSSSATYIG
jgi:hypothetical protein